VPIPQWVKSAVDAWTAAAAIVGGRIFRAINKAGRIWGDGMSPKVLWDVVRAAAAQAGIEKLAPHDVSVQTTERYLGCKQKLRCAVNDRIGMEPDAAA
jgi:hypothetical protein